MKLFVIFSLVVALVLCGEDKAKESAPNSGKEYIMDIPKGAFSILFIYKFATVLQNYQPYYYLLHFNWDNM